MRLINQSYQILTDINSKEILKHIERSGRISYKSEDKITEDSAEQFIKMIINRGHLSVIEHYSFSVKFITDRGISHELVRHRLASYTQESSRYCNYSKNKFGNEITFIDISHHFKNDGQKELWLSSLKIAENIYMSLINSGCSPEIARSVLPNSLKTEIVVTANLREWKHLLTLRTDKAAHPQMRELMIPFLREIKGKIPVVFNDIVN